MPSTSTSTTTHPSTDPASAGPDPTARAARPAADGPPTAAARDAAAASIAGLQPALFASYRELTRLRHDYPLLLVDDPGDPAEAVRPLCSLVDGALVRIAPRGPSGERLRRHALRIEFALRAAVAAGGAGTLGELSRAAAQELVSRATFPGDEALGENADALHRALAVDGALIGCAPDTARRVVAHLWRASERARLAPLARRIDTLRRRLADILAADWARSRGAHAPAALGAALGGGDDRAGVDTDALSRLLTGALPEQRLPEARAHRIREALAVLDAQRFVPLAGEPADLAPRPGEAAPLPRLARDAFMFASCAAARDAFEERAPALAELVRAMRIASLEIENRYREPEDDARFAAFGRDDIDEAELALFPSYLVCLESAELADSERTLLVDLLAARLPLKILVGHDDLLAADQRCFGPCAPDGWGARLGLQALGLGTAFVLQAPVSHLGLVAPRIAAGLAAPGPALLSVYVGSAACAPDVPLYLHAAAALQARAFPAFAYHPTAGEGSAARFDLAHNPQPAGSFPVTPLVCVDADRQRVVLELPFSWADFLAGDPRCTAHFARVVPEPNGDAPERYVWMIDRATDRMQRVACSAAVRHGVRRCAARWRGLQERAGIHSSPLQRALNGAPEA